MLPRGGGTSQAGQTVNTSLVIDCSKHLNRILELDVAGRRCAVEPGIVLDDLNRAAQAARPVVPGRHLDRLARHHRRHGRQQFLRRALAALRQHARERPRRSTRCWPTARKAHFGPVGGRPLRPAGEFAAAAAGARSARASARARPTRSRRASPRCSAGSAATISMRSCRAQRRQSRAYPGRLGGHARLLHRDRTEAVAAARPARGRRLPFRQLPRGDGRGAAHRQARRRSRSSWSTAP